MVDGVSHKITEGEAMWLAGLLEGEGWFSTRRQRRGARHRLSSFRTYPIVGICMTDKDVIDRLARILGGRKVRVRKPYGTAKKLSYLVEVSGRAAIALMIALRPDMGRRRQRMIDAIVAAYRYQPHDSPTPETLSAIVHANLGRRATDQTKARMSRSRKGRPWSSARRAAQDRISHE